MTLDELNAMPVQEAAAAFTKCCGSSRWVGAIVSARPFASVDELMKAADDAWEAASEDDWHEAFSHHPRIGEQAKGWAASEQSGVRDARAGIRDELAAVNQAYEEKFGYIYIVCATGRSAGEMLAIAKERMNNDAATELRVAAAEQHMITRLRLRKLLGETT